MTNNPNFTPNPQPRAEMFLYAGPEGPRIDDVYRTPGETVDVGQLTAERAAAAAQGVGPIVVVTRADTPGPNGRHEVQMYDLTSRLCFNPQTGEYIAINPHDPSQVLPVTIGGQWQTPFGTPTQYRVQFVARPRTGGYTDAEMNAAQRRLDKVSPTVVGQQQLERRFGQGALLG